MKDLISKRLELFAPYAILLIRFTFGFHLLYYSWGSVITMSAGDNAGFLESLGVPLPHVMSWVYILTEFIGGILLIIGFKIRWIAIPLIITFLVAYFVVHSGDPYADSFQALQMLAVSVFFLLHGSGDLSVDRFIEKSKA